jgi:hypothetical protein
MGTHNVCVPNKSGGVDHRPVSVALGGTSSVDKRSNKKVSFYAGSTVSLLEGLNLDVRAEHASYTDWHAGANNFNEFVFAANLTARW